MNILREENYPYMADIVNDSVFFFYIYRNSMVMVIKGVELSFERIQQYFRDWVIHIVYLSLDG